MIKELLIAQIQENVPAGAEVVIFDHLKNMWDDGGEGSSAGMYYDFEIVTHTAEEIADGALKVSAIVFTNEDYEDDGDMGIILASRRGNPPPIEGEKLFRWVNAQERLPESAGELNKVIVMYGQPDKKPFVTYGFKNFHPKKPKMYFISGQETFLTNDVLWLEELSASDHYQPIISQKDNEIDRLKAGLEKLLRMDTNDHVAPYQMRMIAKHTLNNHS